MYQSPPPRSTRESGASLQPRLGLSQTPDVTHTYDRRGRRTQTTDGAGTHAMTYSDAGQLLAESFPNSGVVVTNGYDSLLRRVRLGLEGGTPNAFGVQFAYDYASRLLAVTNGTE